MNNNNIINLMDINSNNYMKALVELLNEYTDAYNKGEPMVSDSEWDNLYFELICCEKELGYALENSPTQIIHYTTVDALTDVKHNHKMLSLDKTKDVEEVGKFSNGKAMLAMAKMDGLTCSLRYLNGRLVGAETRGDGIVGKDILHNALVIPSIPNNIHYQGELVVDGEVICRKDIFDTYFASSYENARNFASGSIRLLSASECEQRMLTFVAWDVIYGLDNVKMLSTKLKYLNDYGFMTVPYLETIPHYPPIPYFETVINVVERMATSLSFPIDGIVFKFNDVAYGKSLGETSHHFKNAIAYKFADEDIESELIDIEWTMGRTGALTPVAVFNPISIEGTTVNRANMHNVSVMTEVLGNTPYYGQKVNVYKANMIIPQIRSAEIKICYENNFALPNTCPICGGDTTVKVNDDVSVLYCTNPSCEGKLINRLDHFCGKKGLDIKGLSKATLEKLIEWEWVNNISDIMTLINHRAEWIKKPGFGAKSVDKILDAIEDAKYTTLESFISSLGIPLIGRTVSKELVKHIDSYIEFVEMAENHFDFSVYDGFAESKTAAI